MPDLLTIAPYLQSWDVQDRLRIRVLVVPFGNPLLDLGGAGGQGPPFADARLSFSVLVNDDTGRLPDLSEFDAPLAPTQFTVDISSPPGDRRTLLEDIEAQYAAETGQETFDSSETTMPEAPTGQLKAYLPHSYRTSFAFTEPRSPLAVTDDEYKCLMRCPPSETTDEPPKDTLSWNEMMGFLLQRPKLAEVAGLIHEIIVTVPDDGRFYEQGGWLAVTLDEQGEYAKLNPRLYTTRVPVLEPGRSRPVFTPVLFPVATSGRPVDGVFGSIFDEAVRFDDGFSSIVHARQPISSDLLEEAEDEDRGTRQLIKDEGIQLGWDNEDVVNGQNRSVGVSVEEGGTPLGEAPRGIIGYRVDVRPKGNAQANWVSLSLVEEALGYATPYGNTPVREERWTGVYPNEIDGELWLPMYFERWSGRSLVWKSAEEEELRGIAVNDGTTGDAGTPIWPALSPLGSPADLQYGTDYDFRVRLADTTGGGPTSADTPFRPAEAPTASVDFRRFIPMERVEIEGTEPNGQSTQAAILSKNQTELIPQLRIRRPGLGYPAAVYTQYPDARDDIEAHAKQIREGNSTDNRPEIPDPDAKYLQIRVLVRMPSFDPAGDEENGYTEMYRTFRPFDIPSNNENRTLPLRFTYAQTNRLDDLNLNDQPTTPTDANSMANTPVMIPTARDIRVELAAVGAPDPNGDYFGSEEARIGDPLTINVHAIEDGTTQQSRTLFAGASEAERVQTFFVRDVPDPDTVVSESITSSTGTSAATLGRFAAAAELISHENMIAGPVGKRVVFGCAGLKHHRAPDGSSLELSDPSEIAGQFVSVIRVTLDRDWSWMGDATPFVTVKRRIETDTGVEVEAVRRVGTIDLLQAVNTQAVRGTPDRSRTRLLFLDAFRPPVNTDGRPEELRITYTLEAAMEDGLIPQESRITVTNEVPIVSPPVQQVNIVGAGYALSSYGHTSDYSATQPRSRRLWIEIDKPLDDDRYVLFGRVVRHAPDPMLLPNEDAEADAVHVARSPLPPEYVRMFVPGQPRDTAGFTTMQRLEPVVGMNGRHFSLPLPDNLKPTSPHLFDFFTYEIAVGYDRTPPGSGPDASLIWVTAQARFGPTMTVEGIQHPPPPLPCEVFEEDTTDAAGNTLRQVRAQSTYATPYSGQRRLVADSGPRNTQVWFVLYARLMQADGATMRNVPINVKAGARVSLSNPTRDESAEATWERSSIRTLAQRAGVPPDAPLSVMALELLPERNGAFSEPLRAQLGEVRVLRSSTLAGVELTCCE